MFGSKNFVFFLVFAICLFFFNNNSYSNSLFPAEEDYMLITEKPALPVGGIEGITKKVLAETSLKGKGKLYLLVYVNSTGEVDEVKVVKGIGGNEKDAIEIVEKTKFTPAINNNSPVKSKVAIALNLN